MELHKRIGPLRFVVGCVRFLELFTHLDCVPHFIATLSELASSCRIICFDHRVFTSGVIDSAQFLLKLSQ